MLRGRATGRSGCWAAWYLRTGKSVAILDDEAVEQGVVRPRDHVPAVVFGGVGVTDVAAQDGRVLRPNALFQSGLCAGETPVELHVLCQDERGASI